VVELELGLELELQPALMALKLEMVLELGLELEQQPALALELEWATELERQEMREELQEQ